MLSGKRLIFVVFCVVGLFVIIVSFVLSCYNMFSIVSYVGKKVELENNNSINNLYFPFFP